MRKLAAILTLLSGFAMAQGTRDQQQRTIPAINAVTPRGFHGCGAPGAVAGNLSQDTYLDTCASPPANYVCDAASGTAAPACATVASGQWQAPPSGSSAPTGSPYTGNVVYASHLAGVTLDCNLSTNFTGAGCTNNDAAINGFLATATAANPITLIMDGATVTSGIVIPSTGHVAIQCTGWDAGFVLASNSDTHILRNIAAPAFYSWATTPGTPGQDVIIRDCRWNGNQPNAGTGGSYEAPNGVWLNGFYLDNLTHVLIEHNWIYNAPTYAVHFNACIDCIVDNNRIDAAAAGQHQDGVHVDGPSAQIRITGNWFNDSDDATAGNASEGYGGPIAGFIVANNHCVGCLTGMKLLGNETGGSANNSIVSGVVFSNNSGTLRSYASIPCAAVRLGDTNGGGMIPDLIQDVSISNSAYQTLDNFCEFISIVNNVGTLSIDNFHELDPAGTPAFLTFAGPSTISNFVCHQCGVHRTTIGNGNVNFAIIPSGSSILRMDLGWSITNEQGQSGGSGGGGYLPLPWLMDVQSGASIGTLFLDSVDPAFSPTLLNGNEWSRITNFYGPGVSTYYRNTTYANLPPATYPGLNVSIGDSSAAGIWGATETGGSAGHYAQLTSNGTSWTVTGK